ncbi:hypothetical protein [Alteromonas sp. a30]|uniref:hypothetical protein n=1 Tax=Alteromonas sp. a30 TaxID=2730917 RepID=UPI002281BFE2|nr:hypothetical protein [Alteromonas sp. a30]MCY7294907.1 hypothetical protein [Alteromonas sp. a30]
MKKLALLTVVILLSGCVATPKYTTFKELTPPKSRGETTNDYLKKNLFPANSQWTEEFRIKGKTIGIDTFTGNENGSPLATQTITRRLLDIKKTLDKKNSGNSFNIVDRSTLRKRKDELEMNDGGFVKKDRNTQLVLIGKAISADYLLDGSVTEYTNAQQMIVLKTHYQKGERARYIKDYNKLMADIDTEITRLENLDLPTQMLMGGVAVVQQKIEDLRRRKASTVSIEQYDEEFKKKRFNESLGIASIGVTARLIDVQTGEFVWLYQDEHRGLSLMRGMQSVADKLIEKMLEKDFKQEDLKLTKNR